MSTLVKPVSPPMWLYAAIAAAGVAVVVTGIYIFPLMIDEAYITYSHARNLARIGRLVYHPTNPYFSVGAPLYAVLLGIGGKLGVPIPALSNALSVASIFGSSAYLMLLCYRHRKMWAAATAGLLLATSPMLWLTLGLETCFFLLLVLAAFYHFDRGNYMVGAVLTACAVLTRWEGVLVAGVLGFSHFILIGLRKKPSLAATVTYSVGVAFAILFIWSLSDLYAHGEYVGAAIAVLVTVASALTGKRGDPLDGALGLNHSTVVRPIIPWNSVAAFFVVLLPVIFYLAVSFGPTLPTTFQTQQGQATIGYTGFGIGTSLAGGLQIMLRGWLDQSSLHFLWLPFTSLGILLLPKSLWSTGIVAWGGLLIVSYALLDVLPFTWAYAPLVPVVVLLVGLALQQLTGWLHWVWLQLSLVGAVLLCLVLAQAISLKAFVSGLTTEHLPKDVQAKVVPTGRGNNVFRAVGEWINVHTPPDALVAANNVGIIGYYADRAMIDFLGILQPEVAQALKRRDLFYAIPHFLPDYIVLGDNLIIFDIWLHGDPWFAAHYKPVKRFTDERFERLGGRPMVVFQRVHDPMPMIEQETEINLFPYGGLELVSFAIDREQLKPGDWMRARLNMHVIRLYDSSPSYMIKNPILNITAFLADNEGKAVTERSAAHVLTTFHTEHWAEDEVSSIYTPLHVPDGLAPGTYFLWVRIEEEGQDDVTRKLTAIVVRGSRNIQFKSNHDSPETSVDVYSIANRGGRNRAAT